MPVTWEQKLLAAVLWAGPASWVSHRSAAALWWLPDFSPGPIEIATTNAVRPRPGIVVHRVDHMPSCDVQTLHRLPITNPVRTIFGLAGVVDADTLEIIVDHALYRGLASVDRLRRRLEELGGRGVKGCRQLRQVLNMRGPGEAVPQSVLETRFVQLLRRRNLPLPHRQVRLTTPEGSTYRVDFHFPRHGLVIEVDGGKWHSTRAAMQRDRRRDNALTLCDKKVLRLTWFDVMRDPEYVDRQMRRALGIVSLFEQELGASGRT